MTVTPDTAPDTAGRRSRSAAASTSPSPTSSLAEFGRKEIRLAEHEMPGLMELRREYAEARPLHGARVAGSLHMTVQTAVLIETLVTPRRRGALGVVQHLLHAGPRGRRRRRRPARHAGGAAGRPVFAWKGETLDEYWWATEQLFKFRDATATSSART